METLTMVRFYTQDSLGNIQQVNVKRWEYKELLSWLCGQTRHYKIFESCQAHYHVIIYTFGPEDTNNIKQQLLSLSEE